MAGPPGVTRAARHFGPVRLGQPPRVLLAALLAVVLSAPISAQTDSQSRDPDAPAQPNAATAPSAASLDRIKRGLAIERTVTLPEAPGWGLDEELRLVTRAPSLELFDGLAIVGGIDYFWGGDELSGPVPMGGPSHSAMMNAVTPREFQQAASSDTLGMTTASAFAVVPAAIKKIASWFTGGDDDEGPEHPILSADEESLALASVRAGSQVIDADIEQRGRTVALSLVVPDGTSPGTARALGTRFVLLVKTFSSAEPDPDDEVGAGGYDYVVRVSSPAESPIASGGKKTSDTSINW